MGFKAGVGVGCSFAGLGIVGAIIWTWLRRRRKPKDEERGMNALNLCDQRYSQEKIKTPEEPHELAGSNSHPQELEGSTVPEMTTEHVHSE